MISTEGLCAGIVAQVGRDSEKGFLKIIMWSTLRHLARRLKEDPIYLGISVKARETYDSGLSVVRVAANSPLSGKINLGDSILKVNDH